MLQVFDLDRVFLPKPPHIFGALTCGSGDMLLEDVEVGRRHAKA
jgi:hypothetical protein